MPLKDVIRLNTEQSSDLNDKHSVAEIEKRQRETDIERQTEGLTALFRDIVTEAYNKVNVTKETIQPYYGINPLRGYDVDYTSHYDIGLYGTPIQRQYVNPTMVTDYNTSDEMRMGAGNADREGMIVLSEIEKEKIRQGYEQSPDSFLKFGAELLSETVTDTVTDAWQQLPSTAWVVQSSMVLSVGAVNIGTSSYGIYHLEDNVDSSDNVFEGLPLSGEKNSRYFVEAADGSVKVEVGDLLLHENMATATNVEHNLVQDALGVTLKTGNGFTTVMGSSTMTAFRYYLENESNQQWQRDWALLLEHGGPISLSASAMYHDNNLQYGIQTWFNTAGDVGLNATLSKNSKKGSVHIDAGVNEKQGETEFLFRAGGGYTF